uniref:Reverse transcriptase domain-containing protein n=1 Tax=Megaselia scalaris TaxID=36166 RepID=T1GH10_MEGSC
MTLKDKWSSILPYADDIDIIWRTPSEIIDKFLAIEKGANYVGLNVNGSKTKYMVSSRNQQRHNDLGSNITMGHHNIKIVKNFMYLSSEVTSDNNISAEIRTRIILGSICIGEPSETVAIQTSIVQKKSSASSTIRS